MAVEPEQKRNRISQARAALSAKHSTDPKSVPRFTARMAGLAAIRKRDREGGSGWCILRTNGRRTLNLAQSLNDAGIEAWTPRATRKRRIPRGKGFRETVEPIVPSFVFVRAPHLPDLLNALAQPISQHPPFSIFQHAGRAPIVADHEIAHLQKVEEDARRATLKTSRPEIEIGAVVAPSEGAFAGLQGVVERVRGAEAQVCFNGHFRVKVATWLLIDGDVQAATSTSGTAALAA